MLKNSRTVTKLLFSAECSQYASVMRRLKISRSNLGNSLDCVKINDFATIFIDAISSMSSLTFDAELPLSCDTPGRFLE